jgi:outer membrane protein TolC
MPIPLRARAALLRLMATLAAILVARPAAAAPTPEPLQWEALPAVAQQAWATGPGQLPAATAEGAAAAARRPARGPSALWATTQQGLPGQDQGTVAVDLPLRLGLAEGRRLDGAATAASAEAEAGEADFEAAVIGAWLEAWAAREELLHLEELQVEAAARLAPLRAAGGAGLLSAADLADLEAEQTLIALDRATAAAAAAQAEAALSGLLGRPVTAALAAPHLHDRPLPATNPWPALAARADQAPAVRAAVAEGAAAAAAARALRAEGLPTLALGAMTVDTSAAPGAAQAPMLYAGLSLPLRTGRQAAGAAARAQAAGWEGEARWRTAALAAAIDGEARLWDEGAARAAALERERIAPLAARVARLEDAVRAGQATADRLLRARRDLHEAEHERLRVHAALLASEARASALSARLGAGPR